MHGHSPAPRPYGAPDARLEGPCVFMSPEHPLTTVTVRIEIDRDEMSRRGRLGGLARAARHDCSELGRRAAATYLATLTPEQRREHFAAMGRRSQAARRARAAVEGGNA